MWHWLSRLTRRSKTPLSTSFRPNPRDAPGDFYCAEDVCLACGAMEHEAPDLIGFEGHSCFVKKQPANAEELYRLLQAMSVNEVDGLRYRGHDPELARRIAEAGMANCCDRPCGRAAARVARTRARITLDAPAAECVDRVVAALYAAVAHTNVPGGELDQTARVAAVVAARSESERPAPISSLKRIDGGSRFDLRPFPAAATTTVSVCNGADAATALDLAIAATGFYEQLRTAVLMDDVIRTQPGVLSIRWYTESEWARDRSGGREFPY
ncbi:MAG: ferredoxin [Planctomycetes bacterium]|nr:ferredoxin [Planctomycetota bacterium]